MREEARVAQQKLKELQQRWQEKQADFQRSDGVAAMNGRLLKEVEAEREMVVQLKAAASTGGTARPLRRGRSAWGRCATL